MIWHGLRWRLKIMEDGTLHVEAKEPRDILYNGILYFDNAGILHRRTGISFEGDGLALGNDYQVREGQRV